MFIETVIILDAAIAQIAAQSSRSRAHNSAWRPDLCLNSLPANDRRNAGGSPADQTGPIPSVLK
jgi:hypothetical protein